jgi:hypothetical protein
MKRALSILVVGFGFLTIPIQLVFIYENHNRNMYFMLLLLTVPGFVISLYDLSKNTPRK